MDEETAKAVQQQQQTKTQEEILAARREARRRKILENSTNRLSKIVGQEIEVPPAPSPPKPTLPANAEESTASGDNISSDCPTLIVDHDTSSESSDGVYPDPQDERLEYIGPQVEALLSHSGLNDESFLNALSGGSAGGSSANGDIFQLLNTLNQAQTANGGMFGGAAGSQRPSAARQPQPTSALSNSRFGRALRTKIHLLVSSIVVYLLFATGNAAYVGGNVFLPLLAWELIELLTFGTTEPASGQQLLGIVFMLGGIPLKTSQTVMKLMNTVNKVLKDVAFFMFFFVLTHLLWSRLWLGIELRYVLGYDQLEAAA